MLPRCSPPPPRPVPRSGGRGSPLLDARSRAEPRIGAFSPLPVSSPAPRPPLLPTFRARPPCPYPCAYPPPAPPLPRPALHFALRPALPCAAPVRGRPRPRPRPRPLSSAAPPPRRAALMKMGFESWARACVRGAVRVPFGGAALSPAPVTSTERTRGMPCAVRCGAQRRLGAGAVPVPASNPTARSGASRLSTAPSGSTACGPFELAFAVRSAPPCAAVCRVRARARASASASAPCALRWCWRRRKRSVSVRCGRAPLLLFLSLLFVECRCALPVPPPLPLVLFLHLFLLTALAVIAVRAHRG